ncbi:MAG: CPBP family intramembrane metalloprotease [Bacteroidaceae bacterium]|nr:CPBP family intramembrane metalloprotease [Bacteroidaceae bacterium]
MNRPFWLYIILFIVAQMAGVVPALLVQFHLLSPASVFVKTPVILCIVNLLAIGLCLLFRPRLCTVRDTMAGFRRPALRPTVLMVLLAPPSIFLVSWLQEMLPALPDLVPEQSVDQLLNTPLGLLTVCLIGPLAEEMIFRAGVLGSLLRSMSPLVAIVLSASFFAIIHGNPAQMPAAFWLGLLLGWAFYSTQSLAAPLAIHIFNNSLAAVFPDTAITDFLTTPLHHIVFLIVTLSWIVLLYRKIMSPT